ncbi:Glyoxalase-like domain protein [Nocardioides dokdonensis FR1436]|uniref:Glyoxalase-like domain protein n=1 Tax=Nocardioides dokdonensis FR1436 TaxID=1300347 RepID=A0A1A9GLG4_9ACTN|nr:VOC family protein [Nocardioides dokdonensis]ANH38443.1 Glyoxalase-like domain protein [Nocardioides dokdonensis FR1436]
MSVDLPVSSPTWVSAFLDLAAEELERGSAFWAQVTGTTLSAVRGAQHEFTTLVPTDGDDHLRIQRRDAGGSRVHLDLHVPDQAAAAAYAVELGAEVVRPEEREDGFVVLVSPGGLSFCFVGQRATTRSRPTSWPAGHRSRVDQVSIDAPGRLLAAELAFWRDLTGWRLRRTAYPEFHQLEVPSSQPLQVLLQRLDDDATEVSVHLDLTTDDVGAELERHVALGARVLASHDHWTVLADPGGLRYCVAGDPPDHDVPA